jgi:hypothetical protein
VKGAPPAAWRPRHEGGLLVAAAARAPLGHVGAPGTAVRFATSELLAGPLEGQLILSSAAGDATAGLVFEAVEPRTPW